MVSSDWLVTAVFPLAERSRGVTTCRRDKRIAFKLSLWTARCTPAIRLECAVPPSTRQCHPAKDGVARFPRQRAMWSIFGQGCHAQLT